MAPAPLPSVQFASLPSSSSSHLCAIFHTRQLPCAVLPSGTAMVLICCTCDHWLDACCVSQWTPTPCPFLPPESHPTRSPPVQCRAEAWQRSSRSSPACWANWSSPSSTSTPQPPSCATARTCGWPRSWCGRPCCSPRPLAFCPSLCPGAAPQYQHSWSKPCSSRAWSRCVATLAACVNVWVWVCQCVRACVCVYMCLHALSSLLQHLYKQFLTGLSTGCAVGCPGPGQACPQCSTFYIASSANTHPCARCRSTVRSGLPILASPRPLVSLSALTLCVTVQLSVPQGGALRLGGLISDVALT